MSKLKYGLFYNDYPLAVFSSTHKAYRYARKLKEANEDLRIIPLVVAVIDHNPKDPTLTVANIARYIKIRNEK